MKNNNNILFSVCVLLTLNSYSQTNWPCEKDVHGIVTLNMNCDTDIMITSIHDDGLEGSVVQGDIVTTEKIIIRAGSTSVRIVPNLHEHRKSMTHTTTKVGNGGEVGKPATNKAKANENIIIYPNTIKEVVNIQTTTNKITGYQLTNMYGKVLKKASFKPTKNTCFSALTLKKGMYLLKIQLENGTQQIKRIIKN